MRDEGGLSSDSEKNRSLTSSLGVAHSGSLSLPCQRMSALANAL